MPGDLDPLLAEQASYYRARAAEYDDVYPIPSEHELRAALDEFAPTGTVLELACGTGQWTGQLARHASRVVAVDASAEMLALNRARVGGAHVHRVEADLFQWRPRERFDVVFFAFWLSHIPPERFEPFWAFVADCLKPGGRVFLIDDRNIPEDRLGDVVVRRRVKDGSTYRAIKVFHDPPVLRKRLAALGWRMELRTFSHYGYWGHGTCHSPVPSR
jgi:demethylmenaquinone methyltransferase/2-methoxy-6-polyprenyl-1,4-benzoquinol methylase